MRLVAIEAFDRPERMIRAQTCGVLSALDHDIGVAIRANFVPFFFQHLVIATAVRIMTIRTPYLPLPQGVRITIFKFELLRRMTRKTAFYLGLNVLAWSLVFMNRVTIRAF